MAKKGEASVGSGKTENQKLKPYLILQILQQKTDEDHLMDAGGIVAELDELGVTAERRSIYRDIEAINQACWLLERLHEGENTTIQKAADAIADDEDNEEKIIVYANRGKEKGYYVKQRRYSFEEIRLLAESVYTAKFLSARESDNLADVLCDFVSEHQAKAIRHDALLTDRVKTNNKNVLSNITMIDDAMASKLEGERHEPEKISFQYLKYSVSGLKQVERRQGDRYVVSPYKLLINDGNYYLLAFDDASGKMRTFRVDRMKGVRRTGEPRKGKEAFAAINLKDYTKRTFSMFGGRQAYVSIRFINPLLDAVVERFGTESGVTYTKTDDNHFTVSAPVEISDQFFGWLLGFGRRAKLVGDEETVKEFAAYLDKVREMY